MARRASCCEFGSSVALNTHRPCSLCLRLHRTLINAQRAELRELFYMLSRQERLEVEGSPAIPPPDDLFLVDDEREKYQAFQAEYDLSR